MGWPVRRLGLGVLLVGAGVAAWVASPTPTPTPTPTTAAGPVASVAADPIFGASIESWPDEVEEQPVPAEVLAWQDDQVQVAETRAWACGDPPPMVRCDGELCVFQERHVTTMRCEDRTCSEQFDPLKAVRRTLRQPRRLLYQVAASVLDDPTVSPCYQAMGPYVDGAFAAGSTFPAEAPRLRCFAHKRGGLREPMSSDLFRVAEMCNGLAAELGYDHLGHYGI